ncbi:MAG TPA: response regulator transcription factor [Prolixibacteraceae bacterium]|jgi:DNA-binding NarL/FixJ family response regulator
MNKTKIIIVDDHILFREGMKLLIESEGMGVVIAEANNGQVFLDLLEKNNPDLVIMDIEMPVMGGLEATKKAVAMRPDLKILVLTMLNMKKNYSDMINAGAMGFVLKTSGKLELEKAIKMVIGGDSYFSNELLRQIIKNGGNEQLIPGRIENIDYEFTDREFEVLQFLCNGLTANEISDKLCRSIKTIEFHRAKLLQKTNTKNTINLVLFAIKQKLVEIN